MTTVKLSSKNQVVVPKEAREAMAVGPGDELLFIPKGDTVIVMAKRPDVVASLAGTGREVYAPSDRYLRRERGSWQRRGSRKR